MGISSPNEDSGVIRCICNYEEDDGFTILCDKCMVWQHVVCVNVDQQNLPEKYLCDSCFPRELDAKKAREYQRNRLEELKKDKVKVKRRPYKARKTSNVSLVPPSHKTDIPVLNRKIKKLQKNSKSHLLTEEGLKQSILNDPFEFSENIHLSNSDVKEYLKQVYDSVCALSEGENEEKITEKVKEIDSDLDIDIIKNILVYNEDPKETKIDTTIRKVPLPAPNCGSVKGVFVDKNVEEGQFISECKGLFKFKSRYQKNSGNLYSILGFPMPKVLFYKDLDMTIDCRTRGNNTRFLRRHCTPNVVLKNFIIKGNETELVRLGLYSLKNLEPDEELFLDWTFNDNLFPSSLIDLNQEEFDEKIESCNNRMYYEYGIKMKPEYYPLLQHYLREDFCACELGADCRINQIYLKRKQYWDDKPKPRNRQKIGSGGPSSPIKRTSKSPDGSNNESTNSSDNDISNSDMEVIETDNKSSPDSTITYNSFPTTFNSKRKKQSDDFSQDSGSESEVYNGEVANIETGKSNGHENLLAVPSKLPKIKKSTASQLLKEFLAINSPVVKYPKTSFTRFQIKHPNFTLKKFWVKKYSDKLKVESNEKKRPKIDEDNDIVDIDVIKDTDDNYSCQNKVEESSDNKKDNNELDAMNDFVDSINSSLDDKIDEKPKSFENPTSASPPKQKIGIEEYLALINNQSKEPTKETSIKSNSFIESHSDVKIEADSAPKPLENRSISLNVTVSKPGTVPKSTVNKPNNNIRYDPLKRHGVKSETLKPGQYVHSTNDNSTRQMGTNSSPILSISGYDKSNNKNDTDGEDMDISPLHDHASSPVRNHKKYDNGESYYNQKGGRGYKTNDGYIKDGSFIGKEAINDYKNKEWGDHILVDKGDKGNLNLDKDCGDHK